MFPWFLSSNSAIYSQMNIDTDNFFFYYCSGFDFGNSGILFQILPPNHKKYWFWINYMNLLAAADLVWIQANLGSSVLKIQNHGHYHASKHLLIYKWAYQWVEYLIAEIIALCATDC